MTNDGFPASLLTDQLSDERARKNSLEQRGVSVITTSGSLVAIIVGFLSLAPEGTDLAKPAIVVALAGFTLASVTGLWINLPASLLAIDADWFLARANGAPTPPIELARSDIRELAAILADLRKLNRIRAWMLTIALTLQVLALGSVATGALLILGR